MVYFHKECANAVLPANKVSCVEDVNSEMGSECVVAWNGVNYDAIILATGNEKIVTVLKPEIF